MKQWPLIKHKILSTQESNNHKMKWFSYQYHKTSDDYGY